MTDFDIVHIHEHFWFFQKFPQFVRFFDKKIHLTPIWNLTKFVRNFDFGSKTILQPFRVTKEDHFSYRDHNFWTKIRSCENRFSTTMDFSIFYCFYKEFLYWPLQSPLWGPFPPKFIQKSFFSDLDFFGWGCSGFEPTLQIGQVRPKRHPKSLVCASERYSRKYPQVSSLYIFGPVREIISVVSQTEQSLHDVFYFRVGGKQLRDM